MVKVMAAVAAAALVVSTLAAQQPPAAPAQPPAQAPAQPQGGRGQGRAGGGPPQGFPAQQRPPGDPALIARGKTQFELVCAACHGRDLRGGDMGGPNLLRSLLVLGDQNGEAIGPVIKNGRPDKTPAMPPLPLLDDDIKAVVEYIHSVAAKSPRQGMPPPSELAAELNILVGDAAAGQQYFAGKCASCHSVDGAASTASSLQGIATRVAEPKALQNIWVSGGAAAGRGGGRGGRGGGAAAAPGAPTPRAVTAAVTTPSGERTEGRLVRVDDFYIAVMLEDGTIRSFTRRGAIPKIEIKDPLEPHRALLSVLTDKDLHDVTAYLATLK
jgi:cytochrome c oxidase cbb3-type subunit 3